MASNKRPIDEISSADVADAASAAFDIPPPSKMAAQEPVKCPYLDTIKRPFIDFDFEKVGAVVPVWSEAARRRSRAWRVVLIFL